MGNKSGCFKILWVCFQRIGITSLFFFNGPKRKIAAFAACAVRHVYFAVARFVVIVPNKK